MVLSQVADVCTELKNKQCADALKRYSSKVPYPANMTKALASACKALAREPTGQCSSMDVKYCVDGSPAVRTRKENPRVYYGWHWRRCAETS